MQRPFIQFVILLTSILLLFACKKEEVKPDPIDPTVVKNDSITNEISYGTDCNQYLRNVNGAILNSFAPTNDDGYVFCGKAVDASGSEHIYVLKTNCFGEPESEKKIVQNHDSEVVFVRPLENGGYILFIKTQKSAGSSEYKLSFMKLKSNLEKDWELAYSDDSKLAFRSVKQTSGSADISVLISDYGNIYSKETLVNMNSGGNIMLKKKIPALGPLHCLISNDADGFFATGEHNDKPIITELDALGDSLWTKAIPVLGKASGFNLLKTTNGNLLLAGATTHSALINDRALFFAGVSTNGDLLWSKIYNNEGYINFKDITIADDGNIIINVLKQVNEDQISTLSKIDHSNGAIIWERNAGTLLADAIYGTSDNGFIYIGSDLGSSSSVMRKTNQNGF